MVDLLCGRPGLIFSNQLTFPHRFLIARTGDNSGAVVLKILKDDVVKPLLEDYAAGALAEYLSYVSGEAKLYAVTFKKCKEVVKRWSSQHFDLEAIPSAVSFKSDKGYCLARHDFDPADCGIDELIEKAPTFAAMLCRLTNADAFCMRLGSIFDAAADRKQSLWMSGPQDCGKSQFLWLIQRLSGESYFPLNSMTLKNTFGTEPLLGKRVGLVLEAPSQFIRSDEFKALTGDETHPVNRKGLPIVAAKMTIILFFFSNEEPEIPPDDALMIRIIDCRIGSIPPGEMVGQDELRARLEAELPFIAGYCIARYATLQKGARIPCDSDALRQTAGATVAEFEDFLEHNFEKGSDFDFVTRQQFKELLIDARIVSPRDQSTCKHLLLRQSGAKETRRWFATESDGNRKQVWIYEGIRLRSAVDRRFITDGESTAKTGNVLVFKTGKNVSD